MAYKIVADSSCDITDKMKAEMKITLVPLTLEVDGEFFVDDETMNVEAFLQRQSTSKSISKSACPSPEAYMKSFQGEEEIFCITLSSKLSGSYASAVLARDLYLEENPFKNIHIFDSKSASAGQVAIALKIYELIKAERSFKEIVETVEQYIDEMNTVFVLQKLDNLEKSGRLSLLQSKIASVLNINLILGANDGEIELLQKARGVKKAIDKMVAMMADLGGNVSDKRLVVAHCQAAEYAKLVVDKAREQYDFRDIVVVATRGLSSNYANAGGLILAY
ncbi:DegV family protein [Clostridiales bacterium COT073_COT-073]|nr:DegV family protein [Clostridiales bacterium COT073_COT-073]